MKIAVTGGAGYIGSHVVRQLIDEGNEVINIDDLSSGHIDALDTRCPLFRLSVADRRIAPILASEKVEGVVHLAGKISVAESEQAPLDYYMANVADTMQFVRSCMEAKTVKYLLFSSTAAVYNPNKGGIQIFDEGDPLHPTSIYGHSKALVEGFLLRLTKANVLRSLSFRYFNASGAHTGDPVNGVLLGERHDPETHLIPLILRAVSIARKAKKDARMAVYGGDYSTPDGTAIRDYVHVQDIAKAHGKGFHYLEHHFDPKNPVCINLGLGVGYSVREIIRMAEKITYQHIEMDIVGRRGGDADCLIANAAIANHMLGWKAGVGIAGIIESAWQFEQKYFALKGEGYAKEKSVTQ